MSWRRWRSGETPIAPGHADAIPSELRLKTGLAVTLMLSTEDFVHGFSVPDFNTRIDLVPGKTVELTLTPNRACRFVFLCDNFCGDGHDRMTGTMIVADA